MIQNNTISIISITFVAEMTTTSVISAFFIKIRRVEA
jgi:hypothetical protein